MKYRCEATSLEGFVQQLATSYLTHGYYFYVTGEVPEGKDPQAVDAKLIKRYGIGRSKWAVARRKLAGQANVQYLRFGRFFVLLATHGKHRFFEEEQARIQDARHVALKFDGYQISVSQGHARVAIERRQYRDLKGYFVDIATRRRTDDLIFLLVRLPFEPYAPIRRQLQCIVRALNHARVEAGLEPIPKGFLRYKRRIVKPFGDETVEEAAS